MELVGDDMKFSYMNSYQREAGKTLNDDSIS